MTTPLPDWGCVGCREDRVSLLSIQLFRLWLLEQELSTLWSKSSLAPIFSSSECQNSAHLHPPLNLHPKRRLETGPWHKWHIGQNYLVVIARVTESSKSECAVLLTLFAFLWTGEQLVWDISQNTFLAWAQAHLSDHSLDSTLLLWASNFSNMKCLKLRSQAPSITHASFL